MPAVLAEPSHIPGHAPASPGHALQRRSRAALLWAVGMVIVAHGGLRLGIDYCWPELRDPSFEIKARRLARLIAQSPEPPVTVIVVGSSVSRNAFKAQYLEGLLARELNRPAAVVNMSNLGAGPLTELVWTRRLLDRGIRPDFVCIEVTPFMYNSKGVPIDAPRFPEYLLSSRDLDQVERYNPDGKLRENWGKYWWLPAYEHRLTILNYLVQPLVPLPDRVPTWTESRDDRFWSALDPLTPEALEATLVRVRKMFESDLAGFTAGQPSLDALEELLTLLEREQVPCALVLAPEGPMLRSLYPSERLRDFVHTVAGMSRHHGCMYVDAFDWLDEDMFVDCSHPTFAGAEVFSNRIAREALLPALRAAPTASRAPRVDR